MEGNNIDSILNNYYYFNDGWCYVTDNNTLRPNVTYSITSDDLNGTNGTNISQNTWYTSVQANVSFYITPVNSFKIGKTRSKDTIDI